MNVKEALESLATDEERERLRRARLSGLAYEVSKLVYRERFGHGVNAKATRLRRAKNKVARKQRRMNLRHG